MTKQAVTYESTYYKKSEPIISVGLQWNLTPEDVFQARQDETVRRLAAALNDMSQSKRTKLKVVKNSDS